MFRLIPLAAFGLAASATAQPVDHSPTQARGVVQRYFAAIDRGDYRDAYRLWSGEGRASGQSYPAFVRGFARTARTRVVAGRPIDGDAAAGSMFVTVPVRVYATLKNGRRQSFRGAYVLRRVNDVDGATQAQLSWHIMSAQLRAV